MNQLAPYNNKLKQSIDSFKENKSFSNIDLDSMDSVLRDLLSIEVMRQAGAFFTGRKLATEAISSFPLEITSKSVILDPTCGAGNLLVECSRKLKVEEKLSDTLRLWGNILRGYDLYDEFVEASKLRIITEALSRGAIKDCPLDEALGYLRHFKVKDAMDVTIDELCDVTHAIMNPPFIGWDSPQENYWKKGKVNSAGVIFDHFIRLLPVNCNISIILPDVLRSGSRYHDFRTFISSEMNAKCRVWGRFNDQTDVDVFILSGTKGNFYKKSIGWYTDLGKYTKLSEYFHVRVGPLVAYRDPDSGPKYPYFHPKNSPVWCTITVATEYRCFEGVVLTPPFILIKRTSSPSDRYRASGTIININEPVAVENHMIILMPKSGKLFDCKKLLKVLKLERTNDFLNDRARMRHLTVGVVKDIPLSW
ncbi:N-6 DNA methylase [Pectobacterium sp. FL60-S17]|uniref:site-specific DNA-methyltransferase (adenine-specific) n=1 Tax=Pectobacterium quasiaquaticum TaxID=2774015 RepID=A0A9Q2I791_9GAMM|nr:N-6 DNA methylase [Pectobacterium quasiaquaticum]MBE5203953.1 N-6 DNA methylase [Pectobacterium quasiaquaticum]MBE5209807.1 N-6 DNA methylase [Pectobacterium quasiaquaticum]MBE5214096.1 N-6 DNA methylase [Pectobacterium quasiaquaticum]MBE5223356.1 N-6 DNA methylase [Pectobacterium quasiaquaticum]MBE5227231.1 N-6 DNA methylase [Pectobacterium quasiaquaticum]